MIASEDPIRHFLLLQVRRFVERAVQIPGIERIALVGSLTTEKPDPKDADVLVTVRDDADLASLAAEGRRLKGRTQTRNKTADIFLCDPSGIYIGRTCHWRDCRPGVRMACDALHCGRRHYLHDDLRCVTLSTALVTKPPLVLWPRVIRNAALPADLERILIPRENRFPSHA
ncbi:MAG TPA: hypothetical protein VFC78_13955 [Tepidisphaeraceae bacterium]|nr:hypothetical protein [Tepidisphaeraceae bacterium]